MCRTIVSIGVMIATFVAVMTLFFLPLPAEKQIETTIISPHIVQQTVMLEGKAVQSEKQAIIAPVAGRLEKLYIKSGDPIHKGQLLAKIDSKAEELALEQMYQLYALKDGAAQLVNSVHVERITDLFEQHQALKAMLECKQIRATTDGFIENVYTVEGSYLTEAFPIGEITGEHLQITALWMSCLGQTPVPGMKAWWCGADGTKKVSLQLERVDAPAMQENMLVYPLVFSFNEDIGTTVQSGDCAPICLVTDSAYAAATVPSEAIDQNGMVWQVTDGHVKPFFVKSNNNMEYAQVQEHFLGQPVVMHPDKHALFEGMQVRTVEGL